MSHFGDFMDGVPVKISEKYKRPPRIELPYIVHESPLRAQHVVENVKYSSTFETNVLSKLKELRSAKETRKNERKHRLQLLEEAKQKKLDAIATAEAEEKLKQLSVSEVTYPSTDEFNTLTPDEKTDEICDTIPSQENSPEVVEVTTSTDVTFTPCSNSGESQLNILQPIQVQSNYPQGSLLDDPDPLQALKRTSKITKINYNRNVETLTFRDFEHDTSSPFDNVELKTINDMELLAQVLQSQRDSTTSCHPQSSYIPEQSYMTMPNCASQAQLEGMTYLPNAYMEQAVQGPSAMYASPQHYPISNGYYMPADNTCEPTIPIDNVNMYTPNYQYYIPSNQYPVDPTYYSNQVNSSDIQAQNGTTYVPQPYYYQYPQMPQYSMPNTVYNSPQNQNPSSVQTENVETSTSTTHIIKSRSRSVPDIVKELDEELASEKLRATERSYNASPAPKVIPQTPSNSDRREERRSKRKNEQLPNPYSKLSSKLQSMCQKIHGMGFPLDRVARVCTLVGDNDKKVIEGLLILGDLVDLGFSEGRVSAALAKHEFNRDKALDELVS